MKKLAFYTVLGALAAHGQIAAQTLPDGVQLYRATRTPAQNGGLTGFWVAFKNIYTQWEAPASPPFRKSVAFLVGVSDYKENSGFKSLPGVEKDLDRMRDFLLNKGGFDEVYVARKAAATPAIVTKYMMDVFHDKSKIGLDDRLLFYYTGHGDVTSSKVPYMMFAGAIHDNFGIDALKVKSYEDWSDRVLAKHALFIFDACKAGNAIDHKASLEEALSQNGSRLFVSAGTGDQNAWSANGGSIFTDMLIKILESGTADLQSGMVTIQQVVAQAQLVAAGFAGQPGFTPMSPDLGRVDSAHEGTFVFLNPAVRNPKLTSSAQTVLGLRAKGTDTPADGDLLARLELEHWIFIKDKNNEQLFQEHVDRFQQGLFTAAAKMELDRIKKGRPITDASKLSFADLRAQADAGNVDAIAELGIRYLDGAKGADKDLVEAKRRLEQAAVQRHADAAYRLGVLLYNGATGVAPDKAKGMDWIQKGDEYGSGAAANFLGYDYMHGEDGFTTDQGKAVEMFQRGAGRGNRDAINNLGLAYDHGQGGLAKDEKIALTLYRRAADLGDPYAMNNLGVDYLNGLGGLAKDETKAVEWFRRGSEQDNPLAITSLGVAYDLGRGVAKDEKKAAELYQRAADLGNRIAMNNLGASYREGKGGLAKDEKKAVEWFQRGTDLGNRESMTNLGVAYERGQGVPKDETKAAELYQRAADLGNPIAMSNLGAFYRDGRGGLHKDDKKAVELFQRGTNLGDGESMTNLGVAYELGQGVPKDETKASELYQRAANLGEPFAMVNLGRRYRFGLGGLPKDEEKAKQWYQRAADLGNEDARKQLETLK